MTTHPTRTAASPGETARRPHRSALLVSAEANSKARATSMARSMTLALPSLLAAALLGGCASPVITSPTDPQALLEAEPAAAGAPTSVIVVGSVSPMPAGATQVARLLDVPWASLPPGSQVIVGAGPQQGPVMINARGSASQPITVRPAVKGSTIPLSYGVDFQGASYVKVSGMSVVGAPWPAFTIRYASHHITVADSIVRQSDSGVAIWADAAVGNQILNNTFEDNQTIGIGVSGTNTPPMERTRIAGNRITRSGHHGMEIHGSNYLIERNVTSYSGLAIGGTSGIHLYSRYESEGTGDFNVIRYNFSHHNRDPWMSDGNGIQVDQFCDNNEVAYNVSWGNDGAGIIVFDGMNNTVQGNTTKGNGLNSGGTHGDLGEIIINSAGTHLNRSKGNRVFDNIVVPTRPNVPGIFVDYTSAPNDNVIGPNLYNHRAQGSALQRGPQIGRTGAEIDGISGTTGNLVESPRFVREASPIHHGLKLIKQPSGKGRVVQGQKDMLGLTAAPHYSFFGAYYSDPRR